MSATPKTNQKLAIRTLAGLFALGALFAGYRYFESLKGDFDRAPASTAGTIIAIKYEEDGQRVVAIKPNGTELANAGWTTGVTDRDVTWTPDGNRVYFVSDRQASEKDAKTKGTNIYRWNPDAGGEPNRRTDGSGGRSNPTFPDEPGVKENALITSRGFVNEFDPVTGETRQLLPPREREVATQNDGEGGAAMGSQLTGAYGALGNSFRIAKWCDGGSAIITVMLRDEGEVALLQSMGTVSVRQADGTTADVVPPPRPLVAGEKVDVAVSPKDGSVVLAVRGFDYATENERRQATVGGKIRRPFLSALIRVPPKGAPPEIVANSDAPNVAFSSPVISPDGSQVVFVVGRNVEGTFAPIALGSLPFRAGSAAAGSTLLTGEVYEPSFSADGKTVLVIQKVEGRRRIMRIDVASGNVTPVTKSGDYGFPKLSPQSAAK